MTWFLRRWLNTLKHIRIAFGISPPKNPRFTVNNVPDLKGRVAIVTGANRGLGFTTARGLAQKGCRVYLGVRDAAKGKQAAQKMKDDLRGIIEKEADIRVLEMDLMDLYSVRQAAQTFQSEESSLHILINNAGVQELPTTDRTKQGYGVQWGVNVLSHFLLIQLLLPLMETTAASSPRGSVRIINVASSAHYFAPKTGIDFADLERNATQIDQNGKQWSEMKAYGHSKLANILITRVLARNCESKGIYSLSVHPGNILSDSTEGWLAKQLLWPVDYGAINSLFAATSPEVVEKDLNGKYLVPWAVAYPPGNHGEDDEMAEKLWKVCMKQVETI